MSFYFIKSDPDISHELYYGIIYLFSNILPLDSCDAIILHDLINHNAH